MSGGYKLGVVALGAATLVAAIAVTFVLAERSSVTVNPAGFVLPRLEGGGSVSLSQFHGRPLVVNFFASWCPACRTELPELASAASKLRGRVSFLEVDSLDPGNGLAMAHQYRLEKLSVELARDIGGSDKSGLHDALGGGNGMPITAFYSADGRLITVHLGAFTENRLRDELRQLYRANVSSADVSGTNVSG